MSTTTAKPPIEPPKPEHHDEFTGAFGFFRKYQKLVLYTAGIFALITFSITGAMTSWVRNLTGGPSGPQPTIKVGDQRVEVSLEDMQVGGMVARHIAALPPAVLPPSMTVAEGSDLPTRLAILRRAALATGLDVSMTEVDAAIDWLVRMINNQFKTNDTPTRAALQRGLSSLAEYREVVREAMLIGNFVKLNSLGVDTGDAALMRQLLDADDAQKLTLRVVTFDMKALEAQLKAKGGVTEDDIKKWLNDKKDDEKQRLEVFDTNKVALLLGIARFKDFDPEQWKDELATFAFGDEQQKRLYKQEIDRFKTDKDKPKPADDPEVVAQLKTLAQVDEVLNKLLAKMREAQSEQLKPLYETLQTASADKLDRQKIYDDAKKASDAAPDDKDLAEKTRLAKEALDAIANNATVATEAVDKARKEFDFRGKFAELTKDKKGFELREVGTVRDADGKGGDLKNAKALKDLAAVDLGEWKVPELATSMRGIGDLGGIPARARNGSFLLQVRDVEVRPMKPWDEIKPHLEDKYFEEQAKKAGDDKKKLLEDELLRLAKEQIPAKVAEIDGKREPEQSKLVGEWEKKIADELAKANTNLDNKLAPGTEAYKAWQVKKAALEKELADRDNKVKSIADEVKAKFDAEVKDEAKKKYGDVLEAAANAAGFTLATLPPYRRDLEQEPLFKDRFERTVVFLWGSLVNQLKQGESTAIVEDTAERRYQFAFCDKVEALTAADVTRREFVMTKTVFPAGRIQQAIRQSYSLKALRERFEYLDPAGRQVDEGK